MRFMLELRHFECETLPQCERGIRQSVAEPREGVVSSSSAQVNCSQIYTEHTVHVQASNMVLHLRHRRQGELV